uniref:Mastermind like domain containing 1 n=1 Tax=Bos indicus x Bos taurus TaxID=30522 RepID=A0A4W2H4C5_BOBOX
MPISNLNPRNSTFRARGAEPGGGNGASRLRPPLQRRRHELGRELKRPAAGGLGGHRPLARGDLPPRRPGCPRWGQPAPWALPPPPPPPPPPRELRSTAQGTTKRRQEGEDFQLSGMGDEGYPNQIKRPCLEDVTLSMGPGAHPSTACAQLQVPALPMNPSSTAMAAPGHPLLLDNSPRNGSVMGPPFAGPPTAEMGVKGPSIPYYDKTNSAPAVDQELQDLLEELTEIQESSQSELDLEKILGTKPEEPLVLQHHPPATLGATAKPTVQMPRLESLSSSKDFASSCSLDTGVSLQIPPSSAGFSYAITPASKQMASPSSSTGQAKNQAQVTLSAALPPLPVSQWHHAHQLKALAASKQGSSKKQLDPTTSWSGLPSPGLSPPYQPVPVVSPQPLPPFSPQGLMVSCMSSSSLPGTTLQGSPNTLLSSLAPSSSTVLGPARPYAPEKFPSPTLQQPPPFSTQTSILANLMSSTVKHPQGHLMSALPTSNTGPLTPYRPETLSSPSLPQQSFTAQCPLIQGLTTSAHPLCQPQPPASAIYKPKTLSMIMQQDLSSPSPGASEPFPFGHTKPLSHFMSEPGPQKMPSVPTTSRQPALLHYLQQPTPPPASSATASSTATLQLQQQPDLSSFLLQHVTQQPQRFQRSLALGDSMPSLPRQTHVDKACKLGEARPPQVSLGRQPPSCQALGSESFLPSSSFAHELAQVTSSYSTSEAAPWGGWDPKAWRQVPAPLLPSCDTVGKSLPPASLSSSVSWTQSPAQPAHLLHSVVGGTEEVTAQPVKLCAPRRDVQSFLCCIPVSLWQRDHPSQKRETKWASPWGQLFPPCCWPSNTPVPSLPVCPCDQTVNWR